MRNKESNKQVTKAHEVRHFTALLTTKQAAQHLGVADGTIVDATILHAPSSTKNPRGTGGMNSTFEEDGLFFDPGDPIQG